MQNLSESANSIRKLLIKCIAGIGVGHLGGCLSIADLIAVLYCSIMNIDPKQPKKAGRDRLVVSKGHAGPVVYAALAFVGYFDEKKLLTLNRIGTSLPSHCNMQLTPGIDMTTGSLGQGFSAAVGMAIGSKILNDGAYIYAIIGDGESQEGQIWEAAMYAAHKQLNNLIGFTDCNKLQIDGKVEEINKVEDLVAKWEAFGWNTYRICGHDLKLMETTIKQAQKSVNKPSMIILDTVKGCGVSFIEKLEASNHNMTLTKEQAELAMEELENASGGKSVCK